MVRTAIFTLLGLASAALAQDKPPQKASISGTVVNSVTGEPLAKVDVATEVTGANTGAVGTTTTDAAGRFALTNLEPGQYRIKGKRNGYLDTYYGAHRPEAAGI